MNACTPNERFEAAIERVRNRDAAIGYQRSEQDLRLAAHELLMLEDRKAPTSRGSAEVIIFPKASPRLRLVSDTSQECRDHVRQELTAIAMHLQNATAHFGMLAEGRLSDIDMAKGADELEAALFFALTLKGCLQGDRPLRNLLLSRLEEREIEHAR